MDTIEPIPSTTLLSAQEAKDRLREIVEGFFFRRRRREGQPPTPLVGVDDDHNERPVVPLTGGQPGAARPGLSGQTAEEIEAQLRQLGFAAIVYTPKEILEIVEDFNIPKFGAIEMA